MAGSQKGYQSKIMESKDERMKETSEVLQNIKAIKLQAWDDYFCQKLESLRNTKYSWLRKSLALSAVTSFIFWGAPTFMAAITFGGCVLMGIPLTAGRVLSALATFRVLQDPIFNIPDLLSVIAQGKVSVDRIASYLQEDALQRDSVKFVPSDQTEFDIVIDDGTFNWEAGSTLRTHRPPPMRGTSFSISISPSCYIGGSFAWDVIFDEF